MKLSEITILSFLVHHSRAAHLESYKLPGYGFSWYDPVCGFACSSIISGATLACTATDHSHGHSHGSGPTSPDCYASDTAYLTTLAYCLNASCDPHDVPTWRREKFWSTRVTGDEAVLPKWDYTTALAEITEPPTVVYNASSPDVLNQTVLVSQASYEMQSNFMVIFDRIEGLQSRYIFVLLSVALGVPIFFTLLAYLPFMNGFLDRIRPYLVYPSIIGTYHIRPLPWLLGNAPTIGQALYIAMFFILNLVLSSVNYSCSQPHPWYFPPREELLAYIGYRTGHIGYALLPLVILFSGRNNFLLWITNWSYSTYLLLHRWIARIFALHVIVHSITLLLTYQGTGSYEVQSKMPYWLWGIVATVLTCAMLVLSHLYFRRLSYEFFLILHILMAVFVIVGCWYHVILKWGHNFYDDWLFAACAVWFFDRLVRVLRVAKNGVRRAVVTDIGSDHVRVDIPGLRWPGTPGTVAYAYFPTLNLLRPWENHPFSMNSTALFRDYSRPAVAANRTASASASLEGDHSSSSDDDGRQDIEKLPGKVTLASSSSPSPPSSTSEKPDTNGNTATAKASGTDGITLIIKKNQGLTRLLQGHGQLMTLLDGPYPQHASAAMLQTDRLVLIGGGIGITGLLAWAHAGHRNVKLAWSVKPSAAALVRELETTVALLAEKEVVVGHRLDLDALLHREACAGYARVGVVVCGPAAMCDDVGARVAGLGRGRAAANSTRWELEVLAFSW